MRRLIFALDARQQPICAVGGVGAVVYGVAHWSPAAAWIVFGLVLIAIAIGPVLRRM